MAGQIIKRSDRNWLVRIFLGRDPQTGRRRYHNHKVRGTRKDAQTYLNAQLRKIDLGEFIGPSAMTISELLFQWLKMAATKVRPQTLVHYQEVLDRYVKPAFGEKRLSEMGAPEIQKVYTEMIERGLSPRTVKYTHMTLHSALSYAVKLRMISNNPAQYAEVPRQKRREMRALTPAEAAAFLEAVRGDRLAALFDLALASGMRPEEYLGLKWTDIDWQAGTVTVQRALVWARSGKRDDWRFDEPKTSSSRRTIPLPASTLRALKEHSRRQAEERLKAGAKWKDHGLIFTNLHGGPLVRFYVIAKHFKPALKRAGLPESIRLYDLRHSCATLLLVAGENPKVVSERLGHASVAITLDVYSHVLPHMQQAATEKLESLLYGRGGTQ